LPRAAGFWIFGPFSDKVKRRLKWLALASIHHERRSRMGRTIAIGDIHGCDRALDALLAAIAPVRRDTIIALGDFVDRGPNSAAVIDRLIALLNVCRFVPLIGNHEIMMFRAIADRREFQYWMQHGGTTTMLNYGGEVGRIPQDHLSFLSHCVRFHETERHIFAHASYDPRLPMDQQPDELLFWTHVLDEVPPPHISGKLVVVGHTPQTDGMVRNLGHVMVIDTFCYGDQWLTAVDADTGMCWQTNNRGELRTSEVPVAVAR
jgi:serine/threonine protein phosphatase 1